MKSVLILAAVLLVASGCATKGFVRQEFQGRDAQLVRLEGDLGQERTRVDELGNKVTDARSRADDAARRAEQAAGVGNQALGRADEATAKAGQAMAKAQDADGRLTRLWTNRNKRNVAETVVVHFRFAKAALDDRAQTALLDAVKQVKEDPNVLVALEGYTDPIGAAEYNLQLSQRRAEAVRRFLVQNGVDLHRIQSIGLGETPDQAKSRRDREQSRRVVVQLMVPAE